MVTVSLKPTYRYYLLAATTEASWINSDRQYVLGSVIDASLSISYACALWCTVLFSQSLSAHWHVSLLLPVCPLAGFSVEGFPRRTDSLTSVHSSFCQEVGKRRQTTPVGTFLSLDFLNFNACSVSVYTSSHLDLMTMLTDRSAEVGKGGLMMIEFGMGADLILCQPLGDSPRLRWCTSIRFELFSKWLFRFVSKSTDSYACAAFVGRLAHSILRHFQNFTMCYFLLFLGNVWDEKDSAFAHFIGVAIASNKITKWRVRASQFLKLFQDL